MREDDVKILFVSLASERLYTVKSRSLGISGHPTSTSRYDCGGTSVRGADSVPSVSINFAELRLNRSRILEHLSNRFHFV